ncbi:DNA internalization-related competence protein ComEC/Rec2 [Ectothiorhodospira shaposhnikovii]|uniref:DNA internalization-related competence protein ComEC/Rec2 n=1 Tax=Ectothiorhodospira shaposhnikovii TaxID=1054 RepID=UPI001904CD53|nr:DNA internalization-related competence protein ComEC/Rec2 [Ectothiorhodospira shaposhnikovii]MBK1672232.1 DNA internalization-related competence protein ComEC/Rec2 [Ectothiorhodospira shaposhnikovii]
MQSQALAFLLGVAVLHSLPRLPALAWVVVCLAVPLFYRFMPLARWPAIALLGFSWALMHTHLVTGPWLPTGLSGQDMTLVGVVDSLPEALDRGVRFGFRVEGRADGNHDPAERLPRRVRVAWYGHPPELVPGERWQLTLRLRRPTGFRNPGGFDYEGWLFRQGYGATAYVREPDSARRLGMDERPTHRLNRIRADLVERMGQALDERPYVGTLQALAVGDRSGIAPEQWTTLIDTGTNHLMAISGLHVGLMAGMGYGLMLWGWRRVPALAVRLPAQRAAVIGALICAAGYAALAGFAIPTQRALAMLVVALGALWLGRVARPGRTLALALLVVLVLDPRAVLDAGFWLSFAAVGVILYAMTGRLQRPRGIRAVLRIQWVAGVGLLPLTLVMFQHGSLVSPLANLVAVPWVSVVVVPLTLGGVLLAPLIPWAAQWCWLVAHLAVSLLWPLLEHMGSWPWSLWQAAPPFWTLWPALLGLALILAPRALPARWLGGLLLLPMLWPVRPSLQPGEFRLTVLDVGQGLATVVQTRDHTLVYDTGPRFSPRFDAGSAAVVPYLRHEGRGRVDRLVVSHGDNDHIGGAQSVLDSLPVGEVLSRSPDRLAHALSRECLRGETWQWDGVTFRMLHPPPGWGDDNASSCVLHVSGLGGSVLLPGDVEHLGEAVLVRGEGEGLAADVLLLPHHGSRTSSSEALLDRVSPRLALVSTGFENRLGHPHQEVLDRLGARGIVLLDPAHEGALRVDFVPGEGVVVQPGHRHVARRHWHR